MPWRVARFQIGSVLPREAESEGALLSARFEKMHGLCNGDDISLHELDVAMGDDGAPLLTMILCIPFLFPVPLPGLSSIFGLAIIFLEVRTFFKEPPPLPSFVGRRRVRRETVEKLSRHARDAALKIEHALFPRLRLLTEGAGRWFLSASTILAAVALCLPFPPVIPLTNTIPALAIIMLAAAMVFRDGLLALLGHAFHISAWLYFWLVGEALYLVLAAIYRRLEPLLQPLLQSLGLL